MLGDFKILALAAGELLFGGSLKRFSDRFV